MDSLCNGAARAARGILCAITGVALAAVFSIGMAHAQAQPAQASGAEQRPEPVRQTVFLMHVTDVRGMNDIQTDLRNLFPRMKIFGVQSQMAISLDGTQEDVAAAQKVIAELDRPIKTYRITYTLTEIDDGARGATQKYVLIAASGVRTILVQGTKVPLATSTLDKSGSAASTQIQYIDVGLKIQATPASSAEGLRLDTRVEQSSVTGESSVGGTQDPALNQTVLDATSNLAEGKPQVLGSLDVPGTTKRLEIAVVAEAIQ